MHGRTEVIFYGKVFEEDKLFSCSFYFWDLVQSASHDKNSAQTAEYLVGNVTVPVGVIVERSSRMIGQGKRISKAIDKSAPF